MTCVHQTWCKSNLLSAHSSPPLFPIIIDLKVRCWLDQEHCSKNNPSFIRTALMIKVTLSTCAWRHFLTASGFWRDWEMIPWLAACMFGSLHILNSISLLHIPGFTLTPWTPKTVTTSVNDLGFCSQRSVLLIELVLLLPGKICFSLGKYKSLSIN